MEQLHSNSIWSPSAESSTAAAELYPPRILAYTLRYYTSASSKEDGIDGLRRGLSSGLDPNQTWNEDVITYPHPTTGCVIYPDQEEDELWQHWNTPLHRAVRVFDFESAKYLLQHGADMDAYNAFGRTALHKAVADQRREAIEFLVSHDANLEGVTIEAHDEEFKSCGGDTCLLMALDRGNPHTVRFLVEAGADPNLSSRDGWSMADLALLFQDQESLSLFLSHGIDLTHLSNLEHTLLDIESMFSAKRLLSVITSRRLIPPPELYQVYCQAMWDVVSALKSPWRNVSSGESAQARDVVYVPWPPTPSTRPQSHRLPQRRLSFFNSHIRISHPSKPITYGQSRMGIESRM
ncbi:ankyrin repeat-containing domain protein [Bombardia bombarda]|uniref:Ankyrin repeat-containing domain protein n=1 Tax=Bombardia bombarda TaxID=252184 RepID=A0AA39XAE3_9PEZI|nr:ankyrin repeat-containing domain protein [Bombardia bombarda]